MWRPKTWSDLEALRGSAEETASLDFKRELTKNAEIAKDIAAMTVNGGVILYGVDEDKETRVATEITPIPLAGVEEKLRQIAGSQIAPTPDFDVEIVPDPEDETSGVVAVIVSASSLAPHQTNARYPYRHGTTTDYLSEPAVERLYRQRRELSGPSPQPGQLLRDDFVRPLSGIDDGAGIGRLTLVVRPAAGEVRHPAGAWQRQALKSAVYDAVQRQNSRFANITLVQTFNAVSDWKPIAAAGWGATNAPSENPSRNLFDVYLGAALTYPACLSFEGMWALRVPESGLLPAYLCAREVNVAYELVAMLSIAGAYFAGVEGGGHLLVENALSGFRDGKSQFASETRHRGDAPLLPDAPDGVTADTRTSAVELRDTPERVARLLIDRWLPSFYQDPLGNRDLFQVLMPVGDSAAG
jgi:hypothetical protein